MKKNGFTLIEMLVALSVFSIAALALLRIDGYAVSSAASIRDNAAARLVASNEAAVIASAPAAPTLGEETKSVTNAGQRFTVITQTASTPDPRFVSVTITVRPPGGSSQRLVTVRRTDQ